MRVVAARGDPRFLLLALCVFAAAALAAQALLTSARAFAAGRGELRLPDILQPGASLSASTTTPSYHPLLWGATIGTQFGPEEAPWSLAPERSLARADAGGKMPSIVSWGSPFYSKLWCAGYCSFSTALYQSVREEGQIPWISWSSDDAQDAAAPGFTDREIARGSQDAYITRWAEAARAWGHPLFLRFDWEMNGEWWPWSPGAHANTTTDFVAMWRHVHEIFADVGATNVTWVWCPNVEDGGATPTSLQSVWPGSAEVDWTCLDGYNADDPWLSFPKLFYPSYRKVLSIARWKPMILGETASTDRGGSKPAWIAGMFSSLLAGLTDVRGVIWYDVDTPGPGGLRDWPIESSQLARQAWAAWMAISLFTTNRYKNLNASPIPPPG